ncbi:nuclease-related domain-containing protein [Alkalibacterium sp. f15]|uniref:nuclease-related domain-containing protein n=1 Tax=Alkalibacterium sp. f15 TaxID=3414029 RepID=UPI003BF87D8C
MKVIKEREKSKLLLGLNYLDKRIKLGDPDKRHLLNLEKGFIGEELFDSAVKQYLNGEALVLNDLLIESKGTTFQIDSLVVTSDTIYLYEIKNYKGNFQMNSGQLYYTSGQEITNPLIQLNRTRELLRQLLKELESRLKIEANVVFINDSFTLYNAKIEDPFIFPTQLKEHFKELSSRSRGLKKDHHYLARKLVSFHKDDLPYQKQLPFYNLEDFTKGVSCFHCGSFDLIVTQRSCYCKSCYKQMSIEDLVTESVKELKFLFPNQKLTTSFVDEWCGSSVNYRKIRKILQNDFMVSGTTSGTYYE